MTAKIFFNLIFGSIVVLCFLNISSGQQVNNAAMPVISSISPSQAADGTQLTIIGSGLMSKDDLIIIDGKYTSSYEIPLSDKTLKYKLVTSVIDGSGCAKFRKEHEEKGMMVSCDPAAIPLKLGQHTISVQNPNGTSNAFTFTIIPFQGYASIDSNFIDFSSSNPTISGTANGVSEIYATFRLGGFDADKGVNYYAVHIPIVNGHWSIQLNNANTNPDPPNAYTIAFSHSFKDVGPLSGTIWLQINDYNTGRLLFKGYLTIKK